MIEVGVATAALEGRSGDRAVVAEHNGGVLVAALDGLGHGDAAAEAAETGAALLEAAPADPLPELLRRADEALARTRGAVATLAAFDYETRQVCWVGVGNVEARLLRGGAPSAPGRSEAPVLFPGVLGHNMPSVRPSLHDLEPGDLVVMATDGIRSDFVHELTPTGPVQTIADGILRHSFKGGDDALVIVARWLGRRF